MESLYNVYHVCISISKGQNYSQKLSRNSTQFRSNRTHINWVWARTIVTTSIFDRSMTKWPSLYLFELFKLLHSAFGRSRGRKILKTWIQSIHSPHTQTLSTSFIVTSAEAEECGREGTVEMNTTDKNKNLSKWNILGNIVVLRVCGCSGDGVWRVRGIWCRHVEQLSAVKIYVGRNSFQFFSLISFRRENVSLRFQSVSPYTCSIRFSVACETFFFVSFHHRAGDSHTKSVLFVERQTPRVVSSSSSSVGVVEWVCGGDTQHSLTHSVADSDVRWLTLYL